MAVAEQRDWLEPPDWWKKWRPLRWLAAIALLYVAWSLVQTQQTQQTQQLAQAPAENIPQQAPAGAVAPTTPPVPTDTRTAPEPAPPAARPEPEVATTQTTPPPAPAETHAAADASATAQTPPAETPEAAAEPARVPPAAPEARTEAAPSAEAVPANSPIAEFTARAKDPVPLLGNFRSYMSVDAVVGELSKAGYRPAVESHGPKVPDDIPPDDLTTVTVQKYKLWGEPGKLECQFFNDRLYQTTFEPEYSIDFAATQRARMPGLKRSDVGRVDQVRGHQRIASSVDLAITEVGEQLGTDAFTIWQDLRLIEQRDEWDRRFGVELEQ